MAAELLPTAYFNETQFRSGRNLPKTRASSNFSLRASQEPLGDDKSKFYKQLGMFSLRKRIEDSVLRAEMLAPTALEFEEGKHVDQEGVVRDYDLWDDLNKSNEVLAKLADSAKAEEAKLITELAEMDAINYELFKQAYASSLDVNKFLDKYEMSKLLKEPYDMEGACIIIESRCGDTLSEVCSFSFLNPCCWRGEVRNCYGHERWALQLAQMYMKWAERQGYAGRIVERYRSCNGELKYASIELEFKFAYGYLSGERGVHSLIRCSDSTSALPKASLASVDVIPLFINSSADLSIEDEDIQVSYPSYCEGNPQMSRASSAVHIHHIPTGVEVQSTGERSLFANKIKALNRLKAKLLVLLRDHGVSGVGSIKRGAATDRWSQETRKYVLHPTKMVHDLRSGAQFPDVSPVLNGNLDPLIAAHISSRQSSTAV
ncbi:peptide chain release factor PrfB3, chloroplastic isoform X2 [Salvia hispanica]|uniref:peptide chain release factor PrfB3, chloroplastic isoform X2 n=1 Tax=Salvia hispanica TaxID=49212 RepID=UPI0020099869|nr:peptide chain release factor PrfB3, chloroplastic isoform X2 [Salvia hispanica]